MRSTLLRTTLAGSLFLACLAGVGSATSAAAQDQSTVPADRRDDDNGFDKGWLGLIGLAGLLGTEAARRARRVAARRDQKRRQPGLRHPSLSLTPGPVPDLGSGRRPQPSSCGVRCKYHF